MRIMTLDKAWKGNGFLQQNILLCSSVVFIKVTEKCYKFIHQLDFYKLLTLITLRLFIINVKPYFT